MAIIKKRRRLRRWVRETIKCLVIFGLALFLNQKVLFSYNIVGESMMPNLKNGGIGVALRTGLPGVDIDRFSVVVVHVEETNRYLVKRVIGMPGETVSYINNVLYINSVEQNEPFEVLGNTQNFTIKLGRDLYFLLGDNREHSRDSRVYGAFTSKSIRAVLI